MFNVTGVTNRGSSAACKTDLSTYLHTKPADLGVVGMNSDGVGTVTSSLCS